jgi:phosphoenolpyruvate-protein kinase (PTS system EI component)
VPRVKQVVRAVDIDACTRLARRVMEQADSAVIADMVTTFAARSAE